MRESVPLAGLTQPVTASAWSPDGHAVATGGAEGEVAMWSASGALISVGREHGSGQIPTLAWLPGGARFVTASEDGTARIWPADGHSRGAWTLPDPVSQAAPDGLGGAWILLQSNTLVRVDGRSQPAARCQLPDDFAAERTATGAAWAGAAAHEVLVVRPDCAMTRYPVSATSLSWSPDGRVLASSSEGVVALDPDGAHHLLRADATLVGANAEGGFVVRDDDGAYALIDQQGAHATPMAGHGKANGLCATKGRTALYAPDGEVLLFDDAGALVAQLPHPVARIGGCAFSPDGQRLLTASWSGQARMWDRDGALLATLDGHDREVGGVAWSPDGAMIATAGWDARIVVRDREGGLLYVLNAHHGELAYPIWRADGWLMTAAKDDDTVRSWPVRDDDLLAFAAEWSPEAMQGPSD